MGVFAHTVALQPRRRSITKLPGILLVGAAISAMALSSQLSPARGVIATLFAFVLMATPGVFIGMALFGWNARRQPESIIFGVPLGIMISGYVALMLGYLIHWSAIVIMIALLSLTGMCILFALRYRGAPLLPGLRPWTAADFSILGALGLAVVAFVAIPFLRVGELTPDGHAYTWLFGWDFILRAAYTASITISLPIDHIHMAGVPLQMYLVGYVLPAFSYSLCNQAVHLHAILLVTEVLSDLMFVGCLFAFWRLFAESARALLATAVVTLLAYSYYGWFVIARQHASALPSPLGKALRAQSGIGDVSHLYQRLFMVEPQAVLALAIFIFVLTCLFSAKQRSGIALTCLLGLAIGIEFGIDSWLGLTLAAWFAGMHVLRLWGRWNYRERWFQPLLVAAVAGTIWATFFVVHMVGSTSGSLVSVRPYWWGLKYGLLLYPIEYGPMILFGLFGLWSLWRNRRFQALSLLLIAALAICQDLFVGIAYLPRFRVGNRLLPIVFLAGTAWLFERAKATPARRWLAVAGIALAVPTLFTDIRGASNVLDRHETFYVAPADQQACEWIRTHLPPMAIVQGKPDYIGNHQVDPSLRGQNEISLIPNVALRRSALGEEFIAKTICAGCEKLTQLRESDLDAMFRAHDPKVIKASAVRYNIDYLYVGPFEQNNYPDLLGVVKTSPWFDQVYDKESVHIFRIVDENRPPLRQIGKLTE